MDRATALKQLPTLHYTPPKTWSNTFKTSIMMGMVNEAVDTNMWKGSGLAMKTRKDFCMWCNTLAPEFCKVKNRMDVIRDAALWAGSESLSNKDTKYENVKKDWKVNLEDQSELIQAKFWKTQSASEVMFDIMSDPGIREKVSEAEKEKMALCMIYAIWKERETDIDYDTSDTIGNITMFANYIAAGQGQERRSLSPWLAVHWTFSANKRKSSFSVEDIHDDELKIKVRALSGELIKNPQDYFGKQKREQENAHILSKLKLDIPPSPSDYEKIANHDQELLNLVYNVHGVEYWGVCLDRGHLVNSTVNSVLSKAIVQAKNDMEGIVKVKLGQEIIQDPQKYAKQKLLDAEKLLIKTGVRQISESLQEEFSKVFSATHIAEGTAPLALSILIRSELLKLSSEYSPAQLRFMMPQIINGISPLLLASAVRITHGAVKALRQLQGPEEHRVSNFLQLQSSF